MRLASIERNHLGKDMNRKDKVFVAGHRGMVGSAIVRKLKQCGFESIIVRNREELDLLDGRQVLHFFEKEKPDVVILAAAKVGGIQANIDSPVQFLLDNLMIQNNVIKSAYQNGTKKFIFLASSCIYPKKCNQPMAEDMLMTGPLEPTNEGYALAKIAGIKLLEYFNRQYGFDGFSLLPCNLYGTNDHFDLKVAHVLSSLVRRFCDAKDHACPEVVLWGTGKAMREFMHVDDLASAVIYFMENPPKERLLNIGVGEDISILDLAQTIAELVGYHGEIKWDVSKPDGMLKKCMDVSKQKQYGFFPEISLKEGILKTIHEYRELKQKGVIQ